MSDSFASIFGNLRSFKKLCNFIFMMLIWAQSSWSCCGVVVESINFPPVVRGSIPGGRNLFKKSQIFLITRGFQKFWQKTLFQQLLFYYSMRRRSVVQYSDSIFYQAKNLICILTRDVLYRLSSKLLIGGILEHLLIFNMNKK